MRACALCLLAAVVAVQAARFHVEQRTMMVNVSSGVESGVGANPVDRYFNRGDYLAFGPSPYYANLRWGYSLSASSPIAVYFMDSGDFTTFKNTGGGTIIYYTAWSVPKGSNPYCPLNTGSGADYFYIVIYQQYSTGAVRVTGSVTFETFFRDNATVAAPALSSGMMGDAEVKYTRPHAAVAGPDALESGKPVAFSLMPGEMWKSVMVGKGNGLDIGFSINGTNRFNVLLLDSDNLAKFEAHQLFNYYAFYSRTDVLFAHLEIETVLNLPVDVYLVINCVDSLQRVSIVGDITFAIDDRRA